MTAWLNAHEARLEQNALTIESSANLAQHQSGGRGSGNHSQNQGRGSSNSRGGQRGGRGRGRGSGKVQCQVCGKLGHMAWKCFYRYNQSFQSPLDPQFSNNNNAAENATANLTQHTTQNTQVQSSTSSFSDPNWFPDSGATHHITNDMNQLSFGSPYHVSDNVQIGNGAGLSILHI